MKSEIKFLVGQISEVAGYLWQKGWAERNAGNISVNITDLLPAKYARKKSLSASIPLPKTFPELGNHFFFVTGTGKRMRDLARNPYQNASIIRLTSEGDAYEIMTENIIMPTSELPTHLSVHAFFKQTGSDNRLVLHTHPTDLIALSHSTELKKEQVLNDILWGMHPETLIVVPKGVGMVPYEVPGTIAVADITIKSLHSHDVVIWEKHGCFAVGKDIMDTFDMIDTLSKSAQIYFYAKSAGFEPEGLTQKNLDDLVTAFKLNR